MRATLVLILTVLVAEGVRWYRAPGAAPRAVVPAAAGGPVGPALQEPALQEPATQASGGPAGECETGCSVGSHPITPLSPGQYRELLADLGDTDPEARTHALDTLLFHGPQVRALAAELGLAPLAGDDAAFLVRELGRSHARVWLRLIDEQGVVRASVDGARFPLGRKEHVHASSTRELPSPEISGTVHRTGLHHLWTRI